MVILLLTSFLLRELVCGYLLTVVTIEERHDLGSRAVVAGAEQSAADAAGDAVLGGPCHRVGVLGIGRHITELSAAADRGAARRAVQEGHALCAGAGSVGTEHTVASAAGDAVLHGPRHGLLIEATGLHIVKGGAGVLGCGAARLHATGR